MRHPRRHEVFRDVGGALRDKDEDDFVEIVEDAARAGRRDPALHGRPDRHGAVGDDRRLVRQHAGAPEAVVEALVAAANDAGGRDNVTVVYAEGSDFARAVRGRSPNGAPAAPPRLTDGGGESELTERRAERNPAASFFRWIVHSRATWFALGAIAGVLGALLLIWRTPDTEIGAARIIGVGSSASFTSSSLAAAASAARAGDVLRLEPGMLRGTGDPWRRRQPRRARPGSP